MVFRNNSSKGIFGEIMSDSKKLKLSGDSRWLQKVALNPFTPELKKYILPTF